MVQLCVVLEQQAARIVGARVRGMVLAALSLLNKSGIHLLVSLFRLFSSYLAEIRLEWNQWDTDKSTGTFTRGHVSQSHALSATPL